MFLVTEVPPGPPTMGEGARTGWALAILAVLVAMSVYCALTRWDAAILVDIPQEPVPEDLLEQEIEPRREGSTGPGDSL